MMKRFLTGVLSIVAGTALVLTSFAGACSEDAGSVNGPPAQETPPAAFQGPSVTLSETETVPDPEPERIEAVATAYCPCERCCGSWALNRPDGIVYTASGARDRPVRGRPGRNGRPGPRRSDPGPEDRRLLREPRRRPSVRPPECPVLHSERLKEAEIK